MKDVIAIIPARSGSKSVKDKNIRDLAGLPMIAYSIYAANACEQISRVIVSTDSPEYADIALRFGAEVPFIRPKEIANDKSTDLEFMLHAIDWFNRYEPHVPDYWVHLRPTTPIRDPKVIDDAINRFKAMPEATALRSGHLAPETPLKWFIKNAQGFFEGLLEKSNYNKQGEYYNLPKESFEPVYIPNGYVDILKRCHLEKRKTLHGNKILAFETPHVNEVDSIEEFKYIEYQMKHTELSLLGNLMPKVSA